MPAWWRARVVEPFALVSARDGTKSATAVFASGLGEWRGLEWLRDDDTRIAMQRGKT